MGIKMKNKTYYECEGIEDNTQVKVIMSHASNKYHPNHIFVESPNFDQKFGKLAKIFLLEHSQPLCQNALEDMTYHKIGDRSAKDVMVGFGEQLFHHFLEDGVPLETKIHEDEMTAMLLFAQSIYNQALESDDCDVKRKALLATSHFYVNGVLCADTLRKDIVGSCKDDITAKTGGMHPNFRPKLGGIEP
jgi:hypothetical protein